MLYSKIQKFLSSLVIFSILGGLIFRLPFYDFKTFAGSSEFYNLVSIIVDEETYGEITSEIDRYAKDIQNVLENTRVIILPTPKNTPAYNIASLNEGLYFEGYKSINKDIDFESKLVGTVIVGDFNLPIVFDKNKSSKTIVPFTDFEDKAYVFNYKAKRYEKNENNIEKLKSEIWHGVISPNLGSKSKNIKGLKDYFDKNNDYYSGTGNFKFSEGILNGKKEIGVPSKYKPVVFYYDQFREEKALNYNSYFGYKGFLENKENLVYNRFTRELADKISSKILGKSNDKISELTNNLKNKVNALGSNSPFQNLNEEILTSQGNIPDTSKVPDIQTRYISQKIPKKFLEIFAKGIIGEFRNDVNNSGRYNGKGSEINVDLIPYFITVLDLVNNEVLKDVNNEIENEIDKLVKNGLSRNIAIPTTYTNSKNDSYKSIYQNYLYGQKASEITNASECSIYRGSIDGGGKLVEANRGLNVNNSSLDQQKLNSNYCKTNLKDGSSLIGYWGKSSPLNIDISGAATGNIYLKQYDVKGAINKLFDIGGSKQSKDTSKVYSPLNCFDNNLLLAEKSSYDYGSGYNVDYRIPTYGNPVNWSCTTDNNIGSKTYNSPLVFNDIYKGITPKRCETNSVKLDGSIVKQYDFSTTDDEFGYNECEGINESTDEDGEITSLGYNDWINNDYSFKKISSYITHKSPTAAELKEEIKSMIPSDLPVDKNRYIDFISAKGSYEKIKYPALFRLNITNEKNIDFDVIKKSLSDNLKEKSKEINLIIDKNNPESLLGKDLEIYNLLKTGNYPSSNFDLIKFLKDKDDKTLRLDGDSKVISYYDTLIFAQYWNSLNSVSAKYGFIFDNYLVDQFGNENTNYFLPKNKKQYEIAYLGAEGDASNMYIKMDPEAKGNNPYGNIISDNIKLSSNLLGLNIGDNNNGKGQNDKGLFKCSPPDGVPIWEWIPAIMCWLGDLIPPSITFSDGVCGPSLLTVDEQLELKEGSKDSNKNGISNCIEKKLGDNNGTIELTSDSEKYFYNTSAILKAVVKDKNGKVVKGFNNTKINFEIVKIEESKNKNFDIGNSNLKVAYDASDIYSDKKAIQKFVTFKKLGIPAQLGVSKYGVGFKGLDSNVYLRAYISIKNSSGEEEIFMDSTLLKIEVRGNKLFNTSYGFENNENGLKISSGINSVKVSNKVNIFLGDGFINNINDISNLVNNASLAKNKLLLMIENISSSGKKIALSYPLKLKILDIKGKEIENQIIYSRDVKLFRQITSLKKAGSYTIEITDNSGYKTIKNIELLPEQPNKIDINFGTSIMEVGGNISTNFLTLLDKYDNPVSGEFFNVDMQIEGDGILFLDNETTNINTSTSEGYKIFRLKSTEKQGKNNINIRVTDLSDNEFVFASKIIKTIKGINLVAKPLSGDIKVGGGTYKYEISLRDSKGSILKDFNSRAYLVADPIFLQTSNPYVKLKNGVAEIEFKTKTISGKNIPVEFQVEGLSKIVQKNITILPGVPMKIDLVLSDSQIEASASSSSRVQIELKDRYNNVVFNDNTTKTSIEILDKYSNIIGTTKNSKTVLEGRSAFNINATLNPGIAYFKISTSPSLYSNSFKIKDNDTDIIVNGVGTNVSKINTYYFWNKSKLEGKKYNSIYTQLLGSNYGDIYQKDYLAGSLLFEKNNRALAVTSLLNTNSNTSDVLNLRNNGGVQIISSSEDLTQDLQFSTFFKNSKLGLNIFNKALNVYIGEIFYNFNESNKLISCDGNISTCINDDETSIILKSVSDNYSTYIDNDKLILRNMYGKNLLEIGKNGKITRLGSVEIVFNKLNTGKYLSLNIKTGGQNIGELVFNFINSKTSISRVENIYNLKIDNLPNSILVLLKTNSYGAYNNGNFSNNYKTFYYNDPFASDFSLDSFSKENIDSIENFPKKAGIGWKGGNKSLLAFSAGKTVGESVADYMSFGVINLGDPVISLKKIKKKLPGTNEDRQFDETIGKLVSKDDNISSYQVFDYDNDSRNDLLLIKDDKYFKLLENKKVEGNFLDKGNIAYVVDLGNEDLIKTGDFTGDGYDDIFFVNNKGKPYLLNNVEKNFTRYSLVDNFALKGRIVRVEKFDMDADGKSDLVTLDEGGEINIFYGGGNSKNPRFTKSNISTNNGVKLDGSIRNDNSLVYFDKLIKPSKIPYRNGTVNNLIYVKYPYSRQDRNINYKDVISGKIQLPDQLESNFFIKSEYSESAGLKIEKKYVDNNGGFISADDIIKVEITLTNVGETQLNNVAFTEKVPTIFKLDKKSISSDKKFKILNGDLGYHFLLDDFNLSIGESITILYEAKVKPIKYGYIEVGLFEKDEIGDDIYGDIILKENNQNCSAPLKILRSISSRTYEKGIKTPACNEDKVKLPEELEKNNIDEDENGIPDYIDELLDPNSTDKLKEYSKEQLDKLAEDSDNDGLPNNEDSFTMIGSITSDLGKISQNVNSGLNEAEDLLNSLSCSNSSAFASPLNWAPLAPGGDPVFMGNLIGDGLNTGEGVPIFSALTWMPYGPICGPSVWPISPLGTACAGLGAGGYLGDSSPSNFFRLFVTPTLTGGVGTAICFGGPANVVGNSLPKGLSPLIPGGNCIVIASKLGGGGRSGGAGNLGDVGSIGIPNYSGNGNGEGSFGLINGNCKASQDVASPIIKKEKIDNYLKSKDGNGFVKDIFKILPGTFSEEPITPMFTTGNGGDISVELDLSSYDDGNFEDIIEINQKRITPFPSWLMDWVTRQIEEIVNKLTDFPTVFIILPDFSGVFDKNWGETSGNNIGENPIGIDENLSGNKSINSGTKKVNSGIKEAYEFIGSTPLVYIKQETINITLPWISQGELAKKEIEWTKTLKQWTDEVETAKENWSLGVLCNYKDDPVAQKECEEINNISSNVIVDLEVGIDGLRKNIEAIKKYKKIPEKINKLINVKQEYLEQILCNVNTISGILGGWIGKNGDRFKKWVELYILIKAILKSWQLIIDVFLDYEAECKECKNERQDSLESEFSLIDMLMPKIPIMTFPKWPDIIIDLHNIRAGLNVSLPEFKIDTKPILLPSLPKLYLPKVPTLDFTLNLNLDGLLNMPILPEFIIPALPPLPTLPTVNLPDLPPPPKLPKMLSSIEVVLDIIKLITKAMCLLKSIPLVPEWRAGDQIAFLTERNGYLGSDFIDLSIPDFSYPFLDAIKVTTYVNLEFETDFIVELARQVAMPLNSFSNDFTNIFDAAIPDLDFRNILPETIEINASLGKDGLKNNVGESLDNFGNNTGKNLNKFSKDLNKDTKSFGKQLNKNKNTLENIGKDFIDNSKKSGGNILDEYNNGIKGDRFDNKVGFEEKIGALIAAKAVSGFTMLASYIKENKEVTVSNLEFKQLVSKGLSKKSITSNPKTEKIRKLWDEVNKLTYSKQDALIKELQDNNREKFDTVTDIINTEIIQNNKLKETIRSIGIGSFVRKVGFDDDNKIKLYNDSLKVYNDKFIETAKKLVTPNNKIREELKKEGDKIISRIKTPLTKYSEGISDKTEKRLLSAITTKPSQNTQTEAISPVNKCQAQASANAKYKYNYKGLYVIESLKKENISYKLFRYQKEATGNEKTKIIDVDNDSDEDILYFVNKQLFIKENLKTKIKGIYVSSNPIVVNIDDNKYFNNDLFNEAINGVREIGSDNGSINLGFNSPTNNNINNFRIGFYTIVDKFLNEKSFSYKPKFIKKDFIDAITDIANVTKISDGPLYITRKNLAYIKNVGNLSGAKLKTRGLTNISKNLSKNEVVNIIKGTTLYAGGNSFKIQYILNSDKKKTINSLNVSKYTNIELIDDIKIIGISGDAYIEGIDEITLEGTDIRKYLEKPLFPGSKITYIGGNYSTGDSSYIDIEYYDKSKLGIDFNVTKSWELYNLGGRSLDYFVRINKENDYYYLKMNSFSNNISGTLSKQVLLAPQKAADENAPELELNSIRVPVYQKQIVDITNDVYEDGGIKNIKQIIIDLDLEVDSDNNGNTKDDDDTKLNGIYKDKIKVLKSLTSLKLEVGAFDNLFKKKIGITLIDTNDNIGYKEITLEIYTPTPQILDYNNGYIKGVIDEQLTNEPVNIYRFRGGVVTKLEDSSNLSKIQTSKGNYDFNVNTESSGLSVYKNKIEVATVSEKTGKITFKDLTLKTKVLSSNDPKNNSVFPKIIITDSVSDIFNESIKLDGVNKVEYVDSFNDITEKGIYFKFSNVTNYNYFSIPEGVNYNPGTLSIYRNTDINKEELFTIFNDGRINTLNFNYKLEYDSYNDYVVFKLIDSHFNREVGRILFITDAEYIMK